MADIQVLKAAAIETVRLLNLDVAVRNASKLGEYDGTANWDYTFHAKKHDLRIRSTHGAGTNSASVHIAADEQTVGRFVGQEVYHAAQYGQSLRTFKEGWWVAIIQELSFRYLTKDRVNSIIQSVTRDTAEADHFTPLPD